MKKKFLFSFLFFLGISALAFAQGDTYQGERLYQLKCGRCHFAYAPEKYSPEEVIESRVESVQFFNIISEKSNIGFIIKSAVSNVVGTTSAIKGEIIISATQPAKEPKTHVEIEAATLDTKNKSINKKMKKKHLEVDKFPFIIFESIDIILEESMDSKPYQPINFSLKGTLNLHGVKKEINIPCSLIHYEKENEIMIKGRFTIKMRDYNISRPAFLFLRVKDEIVIFFHIFAQEKRVKALY